VVWQLGVWLFFVLVCGGCNGFLIIVVAAAPSFFNNNQQAGLRRLFLLLRLGAVAGWRGRFLQAVWRL